MHLAQAMYEGYCQHTNWKSLATGADLPQWEGLRPDIKAAWEASAEFVMAKEPLTPTVIETEFMQADPETDRELSLIDQAAMRTCASDPYPIMARLKDPMIIQLLHAGIGMATETGEFLDALKKYIFYGKPLDKTNLSEEIGDASWYHRIAADALDETYLEIMLRNVRKLKARFPEKFTEASARARDLAAERKILEDLS